jgi:hypothetical protein
VRVRYGCEGDPIRLDDIGVDAARDQSDPGARAAARLAAQLHAHRRGRIGGSLALALLGVALVVAAEPLTGVAGARVGAVVAALCLIGLAVVVWPWTWSRAEHEHHQLDSIWREVRTDAGLEVPWERYAAWAEAEPESVQLQLIRCAPGRPRAGGAPSPFSRKRLRQLDPDDVAGAAEAMEAVRARASEREQAARERHTQRQLESEWRRHEARLAAIDRELEQAVEAGEEQARREVADQEAADRRAQAEAVARSLRRP